jgi:predicted transcriptional regulator
MRRSKLEMYVKILKVLAQKSPLKLTHIMYKANVNCNVLKGHLNVLTNKGIVEERIIDGNRVVYSITQRGVTALKCVRELNLMLPIAEEDSSNIPYLY